MSAAITVASRIGGYVAAAALVYVMVATVAEVVRRKLFGTSFPIVLESSEVALVVGAFMGLGLAQQMKVHVATTLLLDRVGPALARAMLVTALLVVIALMAWLVYESGSAAWSAYERGEARQGLYPVPTWPARLAIVVGFALLLLETGRDAIVAAFGSGPPPVHQGESVL